MTETEQLQAEVTRLQEELRLALAAWRWALTVGDVCPTRSSPPQPQPQPRRQ